MVGGTKAETGSAGYEKRGLPLLFNCVGKARRSALSAASADSLITAPEILANELKRRESEQDAGTESRAGSEEEGFLGQI